MNEAKEMAELILSEDSPRLKCEVEPLAIAYLAELDRSYNRGLQALQYRNLAVAKGATKEEMLTAEDSDLPSHWERLRDENDELRRKYEHVMGLCRSAVMVHGICQPRERKACTACNAIDEMRALVAEWGGHTIRLHCVLSDKVQP